MKIKVYVVDMEISGRAKRRALLIAAPIALLLGAAAIVHASVPSKFNAGDRLSAKSLNDNFAALDARTVPAGTIVAFGGSVIPLGWVPCDGSEVSRTDYSSLFGAVGIAWGGGDGIATFNVPDLRGVFLRGVDPTKKHDPEGANRKLASVQSDSFASHTHLASEQPHAHTTWSVYQGQNVPAGEAPFFWYAGSPDAVPHGATSKDTTGGITIAATGGNENRPVNVAINYIIKF